MKNYRVSKQRSAFVSFANLLVLTTCYGLLSKKSNGYRYSSRISVMLVRTIGYEVVRFDEHK